MKVGFVISSIFRLIKHNTLVCLKKFNIQYNLIDVTTDLGDIIQIGFGTLPFYDGNHCLINGTRFQFEGANKPKTKINKTDVVNIAYMYLRALTL